MTKERLTYVDTAKFIAIFCVLASHSYMSAPVSHLFFYFQVPLFFILHGYVHKERNNLTIPYYLMNSGKKLVYRVLVPYFLLAFILGSSLSGRNFLYVLYGSMHSMVNITSTHLWYLPCFFLTVLLFNLLMILTTKRKCLRPLLILIIGISGALVDVNSDLKVLWGGVSYHFTGDGINTITDKYLGLPFSINSAFTAVVFMYVGTLLRIIENKYEIINKRILSWSLFFVFIVIGSLFMVLNGQYTSVVHLSFALYGNYFYYLLAAICYSISIVILSSKIDNPIFSKYGKLTFPIYTFHLVFMFVPATLFNLLPFEVDINIKAITSGIIVLCILCIIIPFIRKIDPIIIGEHE